MACCTFFLTLIFVSLPPQIAALQKGGDSFPLTAASGKVLGKVRQRTDTQKIETNTLNKGVVLLLPTSKNTHPAKSQTQQNAYHNHRKREKCGKVARDVSLCVQALRSSDKSSKPVYVSVGHKISVDTAVRLTHSCCRYRVPEPIRQVHTHKHTHTLSVNSECANQLLQGSPSCRKGRARCKRLSDQNKQRVELLSCEAECCVAHHLCNSVLL